MIYVKYDGGRLTPTPNKTIKNGVIIKDYNAEKNEAMLLDDGYSKIAFTDYKDYTDGKKSYNPDTQLFEDLTKTTEYKNKVKKEKQNKKYNDYQKRIIAIKIRR